MFKTNEKLFYARFLWVVRPLKKSIFMVSSFFMFVASSPEGDALGGQAGNFLSQDTG